MPSNEPKLLNPQHEDIRRTNRENWEVMKPFVHFAYKAIKVIAIGLIAVVKALPSLKPGKNPGTAVKRK